jgi:hypothetical protein
MTWYEALTYLLIGVAVRVLTPRERIWVSILLTLAVVSMLVLITRSA